MKISDLSIRRPVLASMLSLALVGVSVVAANRRRRSKREAETDA